MKMKVISLCLTMVLVFSVTMVSFAESNDSYKNTIKENEIKVDRIESYEGLAQHPSNSVEGSIEIMRENPPAYWKLGSSVTYNQYIRDVTIGTIAGALASKLGGSSVKWRDVASGLLAGSLAGSISATLWAKKTVYYKANTDGNGYPYYCQEIVETWLDPSHSTHAYTTVKYFYSYQPY